MKLQIKLISIFFFLIFNRHLFSQDFNLRWSYNFESGSITYATPTFEKINNDNILDLLVVYYSNGQGYLACIDGITADTIWNSRIKNNYPYGNAITHDVNRDFIPDAIVAGTLGELNCIDGATGKLIWEFYNDSINPLAIELYSFYNPKFIRDVNNDGISDLLISNGGNPDLEPYSTERKTGFLYILDPTNGSVIAKDSFPDKKETYFSPIVFGDFVLYGTGGETDTGSLWITNIEDILNEKVFTHSLRLVGPYKKGFIQPAIIADINGDNIKDIIAVNLDGHIDLIDGISHTSFWHKQFEGYEIYTEPSIVFYDNDNFPDIYITLSKGQFDDEQPYDGFKNIIINSKSKEIIDIDSLGYYYQSQTNISYLYHNELHVISTPNSNIDSILYISFLDNNLSTNNITNVLPPQMGYNFFNTPTLKDIDNDGLAELFILYHDNVTNNIIINCFSTSIHQDSVIWSTYYGNNHNSIFDNNIFTSIKNFEEIREIKVFPTITNDFLTLLTVDFPNKEYFNIYSLSGQRYMSGAILQDKKIDVSSLPTGEYIITFIIDNFNFYAKFVKI